MGKPGKRKATKTLFGEKSPNTPSYKKQSIAKSFEQDADNKLVGGDENLLVEEDEVVQLEKEGVKVQDGEQEDEEDNVLVLTNIQLAVGGDVIEQCRILAPDQCPRIPLCRLIPHARVRGLRKNLGVLKSAFTSERYVPEKGTFIVSLCKEDGIENRVNDDVVSSWDPLWREVDKEFEKDLANKKDLKFLSKKMFFVWEGNHRTKAWMEVISELYAEDKAKHVRVMCTIIDPRKVSEIALLTSLQRMNVLNEHAIIKPTLRDVLINTSNICESDTNIYVKSLTEEELRLIKRGKTKDVWYPFTRGYLARLVFQVEYISEVKIALDSIERTIPTIEREEVERKEKQKIQKRISDRMGKVLQCIHPKLGDTWKRRLFELQFEGKDSFITLEKLRLLANADIRTEKRLIFLRLLESPKFSRDQYEMPSRESDYKGWLNREIFLDKIETQASNVLDALLETMEDAPLLPEQLGLEKYMDMIKAEARKCMFQGLRSRDTKGDLKSVEGVVEPKEKRATDLEKAAQRIVFRYLKYLVSKDMMKEMPFACKGWCNVSTASSCMYPSYMHKLSQWELENCPWWIDFPHGHVLQDEKVLHKKFASKKESSNFSSPPKDEKRKSSTKRREKDIETVELSMEENLSSKNEVCEFDKGDIVLAKEILSYVYSSPSKSLGSDVCNSMAMFGCCVGNYIEMGKDFANGKKNVEYSKLHEFFVNLSSKDKGSIRAGKKVKWAANLIFLDFPTGMGEDVGNAKLSPWNELTEDHARYGIAVAAASLADDGWLVLLCPLEGPCITWTEKYAFVQGLKVGRRVIMVNKIPYASFKYQDDEYMARTSVLLFVHRVGALPPMYIKESKPFFDSLSLSATSDCWTHYMPEVKRKLYSMDNGLVRGAVEKSCAFMSCILAMSCAPGGIVIEMGCGTAPLLQACMISGYACMAFDSDPSLVKFVEEYINKSNDNKSTKGWKEASDSKLTNFEVDPLQNPYDN